MADEDLQITVTADASGAVSALSSVEERLAALEAAFARSTGASEAAGDAMGETAGEATGLSGALQILTEHWRLVSAAAEAAGVEIIGVGTKLAALTEVVEGAKKAFAPLLIVLAAIAAASATFDFFKEGVKDAAEFQTSMNAVRVALGQSGDAWAETSESIQKYLETQELATGYDKTEVLAGMRELIVAGASVKDSQYEMSVAEDVSAATGKTLEEVTNAIVQAEAGRATSLARLDPRVKDLIRSHADLYTILKTIEGDMSGQAAASLDTYEGKVRALNSAWSSFRQDVGSWLLPWLSSIVDKMDATTRSIAGMIEALHKGDAGGFWGAFTGKGLPTRADAQGERQAGINGTTGLTFDPRVGNGGAGSTEIPRDDANYGGGQIDSATTMLKAFAAVEDELAGKVKTATSAQAEQAAQLTLLTQKLSDAKAEQAALTAIVAEDTAAHDKAAAATHAAFAAYSAASKSHAADEDALKNKYDDAKAALDKLNESLTKHKEQLEAASTAVITATTDYNAYHAAIAKADSDFQEKDTQTWTEALLTFEKTNAQKVLIYRAMTNAIIGDDADSAERRRELTEKATQAEIAALQDVANAYKKWVEDATKEVDTLIDDIVVKHERMQTELKSIFDQIEKNWVESISKMIASSPGFAQLFGAPGTGSSGFGGLISGSGGNQPTFTAGALNVHIASGGSDYLSAVTGSTTGVASNSTTALLNSQSPATVVAGGGGGGSAAGGLGVIGSLLGALAGGTGAGEGLATAVTGQQANTTNGAIGGLLGGGGIFAALAASGPLGLAAASTPLGLAVIGGAALLGAFGGSMIGPHYSATDNPDMYDESSPAFGSYDQFLPNYQGSIATINGGQYTPQNQYWTANGGTSLQSQIANEIDTANMSSLTQAQQSILTQLQQLNGGTTGDNLNITSEHQGQFTLASGQTVSVSQLESLVSQYQTAFGSAGGSPIYSIGRSYPDFNLGTLTNTGTSTPATGGTTTQVGNTTVIVQNPTIVGASGLNDVAVAIGQAMQRANNGLVVGSPSTYNGLAPTLRATVGGNA